jgi:hypothetical protein
VASGTIVQPQPDKPINWPGITIGGLIIAAGLAWWFA